MPTIVVLTPPTLAQEPVSLALLNAVLRLDLDSGQLAAYAQAPDPDAVLTLDAGALPEWGSDAPAVALSPELEHLGLLLSGARELVEGYTGGYYAAQTLAVTYRLDEPYELPAGGTAKGVTGFFTTLEALQSQASYLEEYRKGISINRELPWGEALAQTYTVQVAIAGTAVPAAVKLAILELAGEWYRNRETTLAGVTRLTELPVNYKVKLAPYRRNVLSTY